MNREKGLSLIELISTLTIAMLLALAVIPSFITISRQLRFHIATQEFVQALALARNEAVTRKCRITLSRGTQQWEEGWIMFADPNNNAIHDDAEIVLQQGQANKEWLTIRGNKTVNAFVSYVPTGEAALLNNGWQAGTFILCPTQPLPKGYKLIINRGGRVRLEEISYRPTCTD